MNIERKKQIERATYIGMIVNLLLAVIKGLAGLFSGSKALVADAVESATDVISSIAVIAGVRAAQKPPDEEHPYGHGKAENIATIIVSILIIIVAIQIGVSSFKVLLSEIPTPPKAVAIYVILFTILIKELLVQYKIRLGKKFNSSALIAEAKHHRTDVLSSIATLIGVSGAIIGSIINAPILIYLDPLAGIFVSIMVFIMGIKLGKESSQMMMEQVLSIEETLAFKHTVKDVDGVIKIDQLYARTHGHYVIIDIKISVHAKLSVEEGHQISKNVKQKLIEHHTEVRDVLVHVNPCDE